MKRMHEFSVPWLNAITPLLSVLMLTLLAVINLVGFAHITALHQMGGAAWWDVGSRGSVLLAFAVGLLWSAGYGLTRFVDELKTRRRGVELDNDSITVVKGQWSTTIPWNSLQRATLRKPMLTAPYLELRGEGAALGLRVWIREWEELIAEIASRAQLNDRQESWRSLVYSRRNASKRHE